MEAEAGTLFHRASSSPPLMIVRRTTLLTVALAGLVSVRASLSCLNDCSHNGECVDGVCSCEAAFTGATDAASAAPACPFAQPHP